MGGLLVTSFRLRLLTTNTCFPSPTVLERSDTFTTDVTTTVLTTEATTAAQTSTEITTEAVTSKNSQCDIKTSLKDHLYSYKDHLVVSQKLLCYS